MKKLSFVYVVLAAVMWGVIGIFTRALSLLQVNPWNRRASVKVANAMVLAVIPSDSNPI